MFGLVVMFEFFFFLIGKGFINDKKEHAAATAIHFCCSSYADCIQCSHHGYEQGQGKINIKPITAKTRHT